MRATRPRVAHPTPHLRSLDWDDELLRIFGVPRQALPQVKPSSAALGESTGIGRLPAGVPIAALIGDSTPRSSATRFPAGFSEGTYGTGSSLMTLTEQPEFSNGGLVDDHRLVARTVGNLRPGRQHLHDRRAVQWLGEFLRLEDPARAAAELAREAPDTGGVYLVPAFAGLGAPYWNASARGLITGLTRGTSAAQVARRPSNRSHIRCATSSRPCGGTCRSNCRN